MPKQKMDLYALHKAEPRLSYRLKQFAKKRGIELTIAIVGLFVGMATVIVSYKIGAHQEILQASRMADTYFNGITDLFAHSVNENERIDLIIIARTEAIIDDLNKLKKPEKLSSIITFLSHVNPRLFRPDPGPQRTRDKFIDLSNSYLLECDLHGLNLADVRLNNSNMYKCYLKRSSFENASLEKVNLRQANLQETSFKNANLQGADLYKAVIYHTDFENANLENAIWINGIRCKTGSIGHCVF